MNISKKKKIAIAVALSTVVTGAASYMGYTLYKDFTDTGVFLNDSLDKTAVTYVKSYTGKIASADENDIVTVPVNKHLTAKVSLSKVENWIEDYNEDREAPKNAKIKKNVDKNEFYIQEEVAGTKVDYDKVADKINENETGISVDDLVIDPTQTEKSLKETCDQLNDYAHWSAVYENGTAISASVEKVDYNQKKDETTFNDDFIYDEVMGTDDNGDGIREPGPSRIVRLYNPEQATWKFTGADGQKREITGGTLGETVGAQKEVDELIELFHKGKSVTNRTPVYLEEKMKVGDTFVEVSIDNQHVWYHKDGEIIMDTDCVTGQTSAGRGTPRGAFFISERKPGKTLKGANYSTWVNRWMRITDTGVGLHDAYWRGSFGGGIYRYNGSHGCVNLPSSFARELYDNVEYNTRVVVY